MDSTKVFIDTDNEITFILEKILSAKSDRVSLVIPDRASIFSSVTGLKLIKRVVDKSNKLLILVTLDEQGAELSQNAGLLVVSRVGEITESIWEKALKLKFEIRKRDTRSHYMPETISQESKDASRKSVIIDEEKNTDETELHHETSEIETFEETAPESEEIEMEELNLDSTDSVSSEESLGTEDSVEDEPNSLLDVPQVRINIDLEELKEPDPIVPMVDENELSSINDKERPSFLSREDSTAPTLKKLEEAGPDTIAEQDIHIEDISPTVHNDSLNDDTMHKTFENVRRRRAASSSGISNLSFSVGKDIEKEKKK